MSAGDCERTRSRVWVGRVCWLWYARVRVGVRAQAHTRARARALSVSPCLASGETTRKLQLYGVRLYLERTNNNRNRPRGGRRGRVEVRARRYSDASEGHFNIDI